MLDDWNFAAVISTSGAATRADFVLGGLSFWGENPRSCTWQWWLPSRFLVFFRTKAQEEPGFELTKPSTGQDYI